MRKYRYRLVESMRMRLLSESEEEAKKQQFFTFLKGKKFTFDWNLIEKKAGVKVSQDDRLMIQDTFSGDSFSAYEIVRISGYVLGAGLVAMLVSMVVAGFTSGFGGFIAAAVIGIALLIATCIRGWYYNQVQMKHPYASIDRKVGLEIFRQLEEEGISYPSIKKMWVELWYRRDGMIAPTTEAQAWYKILLFTMFRVLLYAVAFRADSRR